MMYYPIISNFFSRIIEITSAGLVLKWINDEMQKVITWERSTNEGPGPFTLVHLQAVFFMLLLGDLLAVLILLIEGFIIMCKDTNDNTLPRLITNPAVSHRQLLNK